MRNGYTRRGKARQSHSNNNTIVWVIIGIVIAIFLVVKLLGKSNPPTSTQESTKSFITITPLNDKSVVDISDNGKEGKIEASQQLYAGKENFVVVKKGGALGNINESMIDLDENAQISYIKENTGTTQTNDTIELKRGRLWATSSSDNFFIEAQNLTAKVPTGGTVLIESNIAFGAVYAIAGNTDIITNVGQYTLKPGEKILLGNSDVSNANTKLSDHINSIDAVIANDVLFIRNNGKELMKKTEETNNNTVVDSGSINNDTNSGGVLSGTKYINISQPIDNSTIKTGTVTIMGELLDPEVTRVTIDDKDSVVSPVNQTFIMQDFKLESEINNIVYKVYDKNNILFEKGVLTVYGPKNGASQTTIIPKNYPISSKDFIITSPKTNPFATTSSYVRVQGTVPRNTVKYITVNDYRLQKFVPNSTTWYYHANADIGTIKEGTNLYYIKFFDANDKLLYTQLFTIIKDAKQPTTKTTEDSPLFPTN